MVAAGVHIATLEGETMTRRLGAVAFGVLALCVVGCAHPGGNAGTKPDDPAPSQATLPWAANAGDVTRFADEEPFGPPAVVSQDKTVIRTGPGGEIVATLPAGTDVVKLASHGSDDLVCFDEPKPHGRHLMGWVSQAALTDPAPPPEPSADDGGEPPAPPDPPDPPPRHGGHHHRHPHRGRPQQPH
jgi:hypothetical protein